MEEEQTNNLREEEQIGGFEPGEPGDDTFMLESMDSYPADLPYETTEPSVNPDQLDLEDLEAIDGIILDDETTPIPEPEPELEEYTDEIPEIVFDENTKEFDLPAGGSAWDMFEDSPGISDQTLGETTPEEVEIFGEPQEAELEESGLFDSVSDDITDEIDDEPVKEIKQQKSFSLDDILSGKVDNFELNSDDLGIEFIASLETDRAMREEKIRNTVPSLDMSTFTNQNQEFVPLNDNEVFSLDLMDYKAKHPSTMGLTEFNEPFEIDIIDVQSPEEYGKTQSEENDQHLDDQKVLAAVDPKVKKPKEKKPKKEKQEESEKKPIPMWKLITASAAVLVFLGSSIFLGYFFLFKNDKPKLADKKDNKKKDTLVIKKDAPKKPEVKKDTAKPLVAKAEPKPETKEAKPVPKKQEPSLVLKQPVKKEVKPPSVAKREAPALKPKVAVNQPPKKDNIKTAKPSDKTELYTVEVYSSPSKEDADDWVNRLKKKSLAPTIKTQKIRDVVWYKVRFGNYTSRETAKQAARESGFAQAWIDRIK